MLTPLCSTQNYYPAAISPVVAMVVGLGAAWGWQRHRALIGRLGLGTGVALWVLTIILTRGYWLDSYRPIAIAIAPSRLPSSSGIGRTPGTGWSSTGGDGTPTVLYAEQRGYMLDDQVPLPMAPVANAERAIAVRGALSSSTRPGAGERLRDRLGRGRAEHGTAGAMVNTIGPPRWIGFVWLLVGIPLGVWLGLRGRVGLAGRRNLALLAARLPADVAPGAHAPSTGRASATGLRWRNYCSASGELGALGRIRPIRWDLSTGIVWSTG